MEAVQLIRKSSLSAGAGLLALGCVLGIAGGGVWAWLRPAYVGEVDGAGLRVDQAASPLNVEFVGFGTFALVTAVLGLAVAVPALGAARRGKARGGVGWLLWTGAVSAVAALTVYVFGDWFVGLWHPVPDVEALSEGDSIAMVPPVAPGAAWAAGPFTAVLVYWTANLLAYSQGGEPKVSPANQPQTGQTPVG